MDENEETMQVVVDPTFFKNAPFREAHKTKRHKPKPVAKNSKTVRKRLMGLLPKVDNRSNEWYPLPAGGLVSAFVAPVAIIFLIGAVFDYDETRSPLYGILAFLGAVVVVWATADASYIAGMRRVANQDLPFREDTPRKKYHRALEDEVDRDIIKNVE